MKPWLRLTLITTTVGGGFTGVAITSQLLLSAQGRQPINFILIGAFLLLFAFVTVAGLLFVQHPHRTGPLVAATALQVPWFSSPIVAYKFAAGFQVSLAMIGGRFNGGFRLGSDFQINVFQQLPWGAGINLFALLLLVLLLLSPRVPNPTLQRTPDSASVSKSDTRSPAPLS